MSEPLDSPRVVALGARSPLGLNALQVAMCHRAAKFEPRSTRFLDQRRVSIGACRCPGLPDDLIGFDRFVALGAPALRECGFALDAPAPMALALPDADRADQDGRFGADLIAALAARSRVPVDVGRSMIARADNAGFAFALASGIEMLHGGCPAVIVGGLDSYYHPGVLAALDEGCRLHSTWAEGGIVPSEGAAFFLLMSGGAIAARKDAPIATIARVATGQDEDLLDPDAPRLARAATEIARDLMRHRAPSGAGKPWILTDMNGERHRMLEWDKVEVRLGFEVGEMVHAKPCEEMGTSGAATGALLAAIACGYFRAGCAPSPEAAITLASEGPPRGGLLLRSVS